MVFGGRVDIFRVFLPVSVLVVSWVVEFFCSFVRMRCHFGDRIFDFVLDPGRGIGGTGVRVGLSFFQV